jgi:NAD-dependent SIR2 family protein deacetylase
MTDLIARAAALVCEADGLLVTAGAGMGVDSGLPDFRGDGGFWKHYPALARAGIDFASIACPDAFRSQPRLAWGFYGHRLRLYRESVPHEGFHILRRWGQRTTHGTCVFTSNVDGQFQKAGFPEKQITEVHGSIHRLQCLDECKSRIWSAQNFEPVVDEENCLLIGELPKCPHCGGISRPNILMFSDWDWVSQRADIQRDGFEEWRQSVDNLVVIEIGAGTAIPTARNFGEVAARPGGRTMIRINPGEHDRRGGEVLHIRAGGLDALQRIDKALQCLRPNACNIKSR